MRVDLSISSFRTDRIALRPARPRDSARLLLVEGRQIADREVLDLPDLLRPGDVLVFNDTKVIPAQLEGRRGEASIGATLAQARGAARVAGVPAQRQARAGRRHDRFRRRRECVGCREIGATARRCFISTATSRSSCCSSGQGGCRCRLTSPRSAPADEEDRADYQTMFARAEGAVAAPTAALHFTPRLLEALDARGVGRETLTLHVGAGTFLPVKAEDTDGHRMHAEWGRIDAATAERLNQARASGGRLIAVGTTSLRLLESAADESGTIQPFEGDTAIFITPGYRFKAIDGLITNFHLPKSTLFMLVSALMGLDVMKAAYAHAIAAGYRFYSYGDASLLLPQPEK